MTIKIVAILSGLTLVASCTSDDESGSAPRRPSRSSTTSTIAAPTTTASPPTTAADGSASDLQVKLAERGICEETSSTPPSTIVPISSSVSCEDGHGVIVFATTAERDAAILLIARQSCDLSTYLAVAPTWLVVPLPATRFRAAAVVDVIGGEVLELECR